MTPEQIRTAIAQYRQILLAQDIEPECYPSDDLMSMTDKSKVLPHCLWMIGEIPAMLAQGDTNKAEHWLCFIQGCLWMNGMYSITNLRDHNRPIP